MGFSLAAVHGSSYLGAQALGHRLGSCDPGCVALRPVESSGPGARPVSPALAGGVFTAELPGKPPSLPIRDLVHVVPQCL